MQQRSIIKRNTLAFSLLNFSLVFTAHHFNLRPH